MILLSAGYPGSIRLDAKIHDGFSSAPVDSSNLRVSKDGRHPGFQTCLHKPWPIALPRCFHRSHKNNPTASSFQTTSNQYPNQINLLFDLQCHSALNQLLQFRSHPYTVILNLDSQTLRVCKLDGSSNPSIVLEIKIKTPE